MWTHSIFEFSDYRPFIKAWLVSRKDKGRGLIGQMAEAARVSAPMVSQVIGGTKGFSPEQALDIARFMDLSEIEIDHFLLLVDLDRAGTFQLKQRLEKRLKQAKLLASKISKRVKKDVDLSDAEMSQYYSSWIYTGIRNLAAIEQYSSIESISKKLRLSPDRVARAVDFMVEQGLLKIVKGQLARGPAITFVEAESPFVLQHHRNWRLKGLDIMESRSAEDRFVTIPMSLSNSDIVRVRSLVSDFVEQVMKIVGPSESQNTSCLNIDWFEY